MSFIYNSVRQFSEEKENEELYVAMKQYAKDYNMLKTEGRSMAFSAHSKEDEEKVINKLFCEAVERKSGFSLPSDRTSKFAAASYIENPMVKFAANQIVNIMISMILPETLMTSSINYIAEFKYADLGSSITFDLENNQLYTVSKADYNKRNTTVQKLWDTSVTMRGTNHMVTIAEPLIDILTGFAFIAKDVMKATVSIQSQMLREGYTAFTTAMASAPAALTVDNYAETSLISLCQKVTAANQGQKAVILGTPVALKSVLPSNNNFRFAFDDPYVKMGNIPTFNGYDVVPMEQVIDPTNPVLYSLALDDTKIYVASPSSDKIVKIGVFGGTLSSGQNAYDMANKNQYQTIEQAWETAVVTNSAAGVIKQLG